MNTHHKLIWSLTGDNDELVLRFFATFSRFEYALKRAGFVRSDVYNNALADWQRFVRKKGNALLDDTTDREFIEAKSFSLREPPQKQVVTGTDRSVQWQANPNICYGW